MQRMTDDTVSAIMEKWAAAFGRLDAGTLSSLYSKNAFFFGSNPNLYRGNDACARLREAINKCKRSYMPHPTCPDLRTR